jgi:hypothetical protein
MNSPARPFACLTLLLAALLAVSACQVDLGRSGRTQRPSSPDALPLTLQGPGGAALIVPVRINDRGPYDFILDTGATLTCVDTALAEELGLPPVRGVVAQGATIGTSGRVDLFRLESLSLGDASVEGLNVCGIDMGSMQQMGLNARGLLGLNFLKQFEVTLDFAGGELRLQ